MKDTLAYVEVQEQASESAVPAQATRPGWAQRVQRNRAWLCIGCVLVVAAVLSLSMMSTSADGFRSDYLTQKETPNLHKLIDSGLHTAWLLPSFPTSTFPNHYTLATGLLPQYHGIIANRMYDPVANKSFDSHTSDVVDSMWWGGQPIWVTAVKAGLRAGMAYWPGSEAEIQGTRPTYFLKYNGSTPDQFAVDTALDWLRLPAPERPQFVAAYMSRVDTAGHRHGPDSQEVSAAVKEADRIVGHLVSELEARGLRDRTDLVVVGDHGMTELSQARQIFLDDYLDLSLVRVVDWSPVAALLPRAGQEEAVYQSLRGKHPNMTVWRKADIPQRFHYNDNERIMPVIALADEGWTITARTGGWPLTDKGNHGYDNMLPNMGSMFIGNGPSFRTGRVDQVPNTDIYPLICRLLGLTPAANNGTLNLLEPFLKTG